MEEEKINESIARSNLIRKCKAAGGHFPEKKVRKLPGNRDVRRCLKCPGYVLNK